MAMTRRVYILNIKKRLNESTPVSWLHWIICLSIITIIYY